MMQHMPALSIAFGGVMDRVWTKRRRPIGHCKNGALTRLMLARLMLTRLVLTPLVLAPLLARLVFILLAWSLTPSPGSAAPELRIATWDVSQAEKSIFTRKKNRKKSSWRHTFGSERHDAKKTQHGVFNLDVDVVLLQGVRNVRALRRVFPTRYWKLILSNDYMRHAPPLSRLPSDLQTYDISITGRTVEHPVTAVAVRYQRRLRVRAIKHIRTEDHVGSTNDDASSLELDNMPSATAVRINHFGSNIWLMSLALVQDCQGAVAKCATWRAVKNWYKLLQTSNQIAAVAGAAHTRPSTDEAQAHPKPPTCGTFTPLTQSCGKDECLGQRKRLTRKKLGCIVLTTIKLPRARLQQFPGVPPR